MPKNPHPTLSPAWRNQDGRNATRNYVKIFVWGGGTAGVAVLAALGLSNKNGGQHTTPETNNIPPASSSHTEGTHAPAPQPTETEKKPAPQPTEGQGGGQTEQSSPGCTVADNKNNGSETFVIKCTEGGKTVTVTGEVDGSDINLKEGGQTLPLRGAGGRAQKHGTLPGPDGWTINFDSNTNDGQRLAADMVRTSAYLQPNESDTRDILARANANLRDSGIILTAKDNGAQQSPTAEWLAVPTLGTGLIKRRRTTGEGSGKGVRRAVELGCHAASAYGPDAKQEANLRNSRYTGERNFLHARAKR